MDVTPETHFLVVDNNEDPIVESGHILIQAKNDESYIYTPLNSHIKNMFGITPIEMSAETAEDETGTEAVNETGTEAVNDPECSEDGVCENEKFVWHHNSTLLLLEEYKKRNSKFRNPKIKKKMLWDEISKAMKQNGYTVDADSLDRKLRNMKNTYRTILDNNNKKKSTGKGRIQWQYYNIFEEIFREDKTVNPTSVMSSTKENVIQTISLNQEGTSGVTSPITGINPVSPLNNSASKSNISCLNFSTKPSSLKSVRSKQLDRFRKRQFDIEEEKLEELKKIRKAIEKSNCIQERKANALETLVQNRKSQ